MTTSKTNSPLGGFSSRGLAQSRGVHGDARDNFVRDESDNKLFTKIQVDDITNIITDDCIGCMDADGLVYRSCSNMEIQMIRVIHFKEGINEVLKNITAFKGRGKKISPDSWLGVLNVNREAKEEEPLLAEDFVIEPFQELKMPKERAIETVKILIQSSLKKIKLQYRIPKIKLLLGGGSNFRANLHQAKPYKGNRGKTLRPLLLTEIREWVLETFDAEYAHPLPDGRLIEADDLSNMYGREGYRNYRKTGKFNYLELSPDKDAMAQGGKLLINPDVHQGDSNPMKGRYKYPKAMLIHTADKDVGDVELTSGSSGGRTLKGYGLKFLMYQAILGKDGADNYNCLGDLGISYGDTEAFRLLSPLVTPKDVVQAAIDVAAEKLPNGVQYTSCQGRELDIDTYSYINQYFMTAFMLQDKGSSKVTLGTLCKAFGVNTDKIVKNNIPVVKEFIGNEEEYKFLEEQIKLLQNVLNEKYTNKKKVELVELLDLVKESLSVIDLDAQYQIKK